MTARARRFLAEAGYSQVNAVTADAEDGVPEHAPYDRIILTAGAWDIPPAWTAQLAGGGRIVVPLRMRGLTRSVAFERESSRLMSRGHEMCGFVAVRGAGERREHLILLHGADVGLRIDGAQQPDAEALREALLGPRAEVRFGGTEPFDGLYLWLATCLPSFGRLTRQKTETARALADPVAQWRD